MFTLYIAECETVEITAPVAKYSKFLKNIHDGYGEDNETFAEAVEKVAKKTGTEVVYAYDDEGEEVTVGLLLDGPFQGFVEDCSNSNLDWIAAEKECPSVEVGVEVESSLVKGENVSAVVDTKKWPHISSLVKMYKSKKPLRKTLKQIKENLDAARKENVKKKCFGKSKKVVTNHFKGFGGKKRKKAVRKKTTDRAYKVPASIRNAILKRNLYTRNSSNYINIFPFRCTLILVYQNFLKQKRRVSTKRELTKAF